MTPEFVPFPKIGRWANNKIAVTEKIDGTNGCISIEAIKTLTPEDTFGLIEALTSTDPTVLAITISSRDSESNNLIVRAGSRNRWLTPGSDNFGFANWVQRYGVSLARLGPGLHYGEWWGSGIQRTYGLTGGDKRFSLFNVGRWVDTPNGVYDRTDPTPGKDPIAVPGLRVVPTLYYGAMRDPSGRCMIEESMRRLKFGGSEAERGFTDPEGVMVYFENLKQYAKAPFDPAPKGQG